MERVIEKHKCSGCTACFNSCPVGAITMDRDSEGFYYPIINEEKCIKCGLCRRVCPFQNVPKEETDIKEVYNAHTKNRDNLLNSSSGGIFSELALEIINLKGVVVAVNNQCNYMMIDKKDDLSKLFGAKYVQVYLGEIFKQVKEKLDQGIAVLFVGNPCYTNGIKKYLKKDYDNFYVCDFICHGVPSEKWLQYYKKSFNNKIEQINFREKSHGWQNYSVELKTNKRSYKSLASDNEYMNAFLRNYCLRPSCYNCQAKGNNRLSDITLGDYWGIDTKKSLYNYEGNSIVVINTEKGKNLFSKIINKINYEKITKDELSKNPAYYYSSSKTKERENFYNDMDKLSYSKFTKKYKLKPALDRRIKIKIKNFIGGNK